ncbi:MAG: site-specific integrase [Prolixibacteraceae bacterium]|jgi:site-specific recombinase XerD|nr:site-specific integrase [Prolixibacteraceae bacterium]
MAKVKYVLNKSRQYSNGEYPIFLRIHHKSKRKLVSTKESVTKDFWNEKEGRIVPTSKYKEEKRKLELINSILQKRLSELRLNIINLENRNPYYTIQDVSDLFDAKRTSTSIFSYYKTLRNRLESSGKFGNAAVYLSTHNSLKTFMKGKDITFDELNYKNLIDYEAYLLENGRRINTVSHYMRNFRSAYNKAINEGLAQEELSPFKKYKVKNEKTVKRAIVKGSISELKNLDFSDKPDYNKAMDYFLFSFYCRGMSFVDLSYLKVNQIIGDRLNYTRHKTSQKFTIKITPAMLDIIRKYNTLDNVESYLFPIITDPEKNPYKQYRYQLSFINKNLKSIGKMLKLEIPLTTYISRHSWATIAKREGIATAIISEGLGHETERTTQIYLDSFENQVLDDANDLITYI